MHFEVIGAKGTAVGSSGGSLTAFTGDSLTARNSREGAQVRILTAWAHAQAAGWLQIIAPSMPDTQRGIRAVTRAGAFQRVIPAGVSHRIYPEDTLAVTLAGSGTAGDIESAFIGLWYEDTPGLSARLATAEDVLRAAGALITVQATLSPGTAGGWAGSEALTDESDLLRADRTYAILGASAAGDLGAIGIQGPDWANVRVAVPGLTGNGLRPESFFLDLSREHNLPCIPILAGTNRSSVLLTAAGNEDSSDTKVSVHLVEVE